MTLFYATNNKKGKKTNLHRGKKNCVLFMCETKLCRNSLYSLYKYKLYIELDIVVYTYNFCVKALYKSVDI